MKYNVSDTAPADLGKAGDPISLTKAEAEHLLRKGHIVEQTTEPELPLEPAPSEPPVAENTGATPTGKKAATKDGAGA